MQNINELYAIQAGLKSRIGYQGKDKFEKMMLAMVIEFAEAANDWQGFKYWKKENKRKLSLLEEYVDGFHFVLEAGLDLLEQDAIMMLPNSIVAAKKREKTITRQFKKVIVAALFLELENEDGTNFLDLKYEDLFEDYLALGEMLGFTESEIAAEYLHKNAINHERQDNGY